ncbi:MAG: phosphonate ABC transporter, permease protein PhnE [Candidatus Izemoplasmatales bacterium]
MNRLRNVLAKKPKKWIMNLLFVAAIGTILVLSFDGATINPLRFPQIPYVFLGIIRGFLNIDWSTVLGYGEFTFSQSIAYYAIQTLAIAFIGTLVGGILAVPASFLAAENVVGKRVARIGRFFLVIIRVFPEIILAFILVKGIGTGPITGIFVIGIHSVGMLGKLFSEAIDSMDRSSIEALDAVGADSLQKLRFGILPQLMPLMSSIALYRLDINVRSATVLGAIGAGGLGTLIILYSNPPSWVSLPGVIVAIMVMVLAVDSISSALRKKLV